ncbi:substrate-binding periplasmic protein [Paraglaciecola aestuariivivens]
MFKLSISRDLKKLKLNKMLYALALILASTSWLGLAKTIDVAAGWARPPYIIPEHHSGFELDLVKQVLSSMGHKAHFVYVPYERTISLLKQGKVDMALTLNLNSGVNKALLSDVFVIYQNVVLTLRENKLEVEHVSDLSELSLVAFQGASQVLGDEFKVVAAKNHLYLEMADQRGQLELFLLGEVDAIIIDINIFSALSKKHTGQNHLNNVTVHPLFPMNRYSAGFKDIQLKQAFNRALREFVASGKYKKLKQQYNIQNVMPVD